jgi:hypothetical protein
MHDWPVACRTPLPLYDPSAAYCWAQTNDEWDGDCGRHLYDGTSVRAGLKYQQEHGWISEYRWALDPYDAVLSLLTRGPLQLGTWWRSEMQTPDASGWVRYAGSYDGGHAYVANGVRLPKRTTIREAVSKRVGWVRCKNSWGRTWGLRGHFYMQMGDFVDCLEDQGEAASVVEVPRP